MTIVMVSMKRLSSIKKYRFLHYDIYIPSTALAFIFEDFDNVLVAACKMARMFSSLFLGGIIFISYKKEYPCKKAVYKLSDMCTSVDMRLTNLYSLKTYPKYSNDFYYISKTLLSRLEIIGPEKARI